MSADSVSIFQLIHSSSYLNESKALWDKIKKLNNNSLFLTKCILQFFVDCFQKSYQIQEEDIVNISNELIIRIYQSQFTANAKMNLNIRFGDFFNDFLNELFYLNKFHKVLPDCIGFLLKVIESSKIPDDDYMKGVANFMLTMQLQGIAEFYSFYSDGDNDDDTLNEVGIYSEDTLQIIMENIENSLKYEEFSSLICTEFCNAMESCFDVMINKNNFLYNYANMMKIDNNSILLRVIKSLNNLCSNINLRKRLIEFFYDYEEMVENEVQNIREMLYKIAVSKTSLDINNETIKLFTNIKKLDETKVPLLPDQRFHLFQLYFDLTNENQLCLLFELMESENSFFEELLKVLKDHSITDKCFKSILGKISKRKVMPLIKAIVNNVDDKLMAHNGTRLLSLFPSSLSNDVNIFLRHLPYILSKLKQDEYIFGTILEIMLKIEESEWSGVSSNLEMKRQLIQLLSQVFHQFKYPYVIAKILKSLKMIEKIFKSGEKFNAKKSLTQFYENFVQSEAISIVNDRDITPEHESSLLKLTSFYECEIATFTNHSFETVILINEKHLEFENDPLFPQYAHFYITLLKYLFIHIIGRLSQKNVDVEISIDLNTIVNRVSIVREKLLSLLKNHDFNSYQASCVISSLIECFCVFKQQPIICDDNTVFYVQQTRITNQQLKDLIDFIEYYVYNIDLNDLDETTRRMYHHADYKEQIMKSFVRFCRGYNFRNDLSVLSKLIFHYGKSDFNFELNIALKLLLMNENNFISAIGLTIYRFVFEIVDIEEFTKFLIKLNAFMEVENKKFKFQICEYLMKNLEAFLRQLKPTTNRLLVLLYLNRLAKTGLSDKQKNELNELVSATASKLELALKEAEVLAEFFKDL